MYITSLCNDLFPDGGETYTYKEIYYYLFNKFGLSPKQIAGVVGAGVRYGFLLIANNCDANECVFVR